jgi:hypothetical protein
MATMPEPRELIRAIRGLSLGLALGLLLLAVTRRRAQRVT